MVEVGGGDGVKLDQLTVFCLFFPSARSGECYFKGAQVVRRFRQIDVGEGVLSLLVLFVH